MRVVIAERDDIIAVRTQHRADRRVAQAICSVQNGGHVRTYQVQGRLIERHDGRVVRDDVRLADATTWVDAVRVADAMTADGFAVWVWGVEPRPGGLPKSELLVVRERPPREDRADGQRAPEPGRSGRSADGAVDGGC